MCIPIRRWVFLWTGFSLSIPRGSWHRNTLKPVSPRKLYSLFHTDVWLSEFWFCIVKVHNRLSVCLCCSFGGLCEVVDHVFPVLARDEGADFSCSDTFGQCNYWSTQLPDSTNQEEEDPQPLETSWVNPIKSSTEDVTFQLFEATADTTLWSVVLVIQREGGCPDQEWRCWLL